MGQQLKARVKRKRRKRWEDRKKDQANKAKIKGSKRK
jgi:hypothetical protein